METGIYLTGMVFVIAALHLITRLGNHVSRYYAASNKRQARSTKAPVRRGDWYMFFRCSDLTGESEGKSIRKRENTSSSLSSRKGRRCDSRPVLRRYSA